MESLTALAESMQQAASVLSDGDAEDSPKQYTSFLSVLALGNVGAGKSAVLNSLIGYPMLPTGENGVTRAPIIVDMERGEEGTRGISVLVDGNARQVTAGEIRLSLQGRLSKPTINASKGRLEEIYLKLRSSTAPPLKFIDLPGVGTSDDTLAQEFGANNDAILLVVIPAASVRDIAGSQALKLAQDLDPDGKRTVGVISKVDQASTDQRSLAAVQAVLTGQGPSVTSDITWVALIGQSVSIAASRGGPLGADDSLETAWKAEAESLKSFLKEAPSSRLGRVALMDVIAGQIRKRLKQRLPSVLAGLEGISQEVEDDLVRLGEQMVETEEGTRALALELCREFEDKFLLHLQSGEAGGWKVVSSFEGTLPNRFKQLPLDGLFDPANVKKVVLEADGYQPYLLSPEKGLRELVRRALELAKEPAKICVDEVHRVLVDIVANAAGSTPGLGRYPPFKREIVAIASSALDDYRAQAKKMVVNLVDMERSYIPPQHFNRLAQRRLDRLRREEEQKTRLAKKAQDAEQALLTKAVVPQGTQPTGPTTTLKSLKDKDAKDSQPPIAVATGEILGVYFLKKSFKKAGWSKRWFVLNEKTNKLGYTKTPEERLFRGTISLDECVFEDAPDKDDPLDESSTKTKDSKRSSNVDLSNSLAFKISNRIPYKTVVKAHPFIILKAETIAEKTEWITKLRSCASKGSPSKSTESTAPARTTLAEQPETVLRRPSDPEEDLRLMSQEIRDYVEAVLNSLAANIPKAAVLCQVERAKDAMLNKLYSSISKHSANQIQDLLKENSDVKRRRERRKQQASTLSHLIHQLSMHETRSAAAATYADGGSPTSPNEGWRDAFQEASANTGYEGSSSRRTRAFANGPSQRRFSEAEDNGDPSYERRTPSRFPRGSAPPVYR